MSTSIVTDSRAVEPQVRSADILAFPSRPKPDELLPEERLATALESLNRALAEQRAAVAAWRNVLLELKTSTTGLHDSLQRYKTNLRTLGNSVTSLQAKARSLEAWADHVTANSD